MKKTEILSFLKSNRNFTLVFISLVLSSVTVNMVNFLMMTKIYERTGSSLAVSFLWVFYFIPAFFLGPFSGIFVDHWKKRNVLMYTNFFQAIVIFSFLFIGERVFPIYPFVFLYSLIDEFYIPAEASSVPLMVKKTELPIANSLIFATRQGALILGFGLGGLLMRFLGTNNTVLLSAIFLLIAAIAVSFLPKDETERKPIDNVTRFLDEFKLGYEFIAKNRIILFPMILSIFFSATIYTIGISLPAMAKQILMIEITDSGPLFIVPLGVGALTAISMITKFSRKYRKKDLMQIGLKIDLVVLLFLSLLLPIFGKIILPLGMFMAFCLGFGGILIFIPNQTLLQENIPSKLRARVFGTLGFVTTVITLPFLLFSATLIDTFGIRPYLFITGLGLFAFLFFFKKAEKIIIAEKIEKLNGNN